MTTTAPATPDTLIRLGVLIDDDLPVEIASENLRARISEGLEKKYPGLVWVVDARPEGVGDEDDDSLDLLEITRDRMLSMEWDLAVTLTWHALEQGSHTVPARISSAHAAGVVSLELSQVSPEHAVLRVVARILGLDPDDEHPSPAAVRGAVQSARELATDVEDAESASAGVFAWKVVRSNLRLLTSTIMSNRPWYLAVKLSRSMSAALATGALTLVTTDLWMLSAEYSAMQMIAVGVVAVVAVTAAMIIGANLWERPRHRKEREPVAIFNAATLISVVIGVLVLYLALFIASFLGAILLVDDTVFEEVTGDHATVIQYLKLAWFVGGLATIGSALGAGLEEDDDVRAALFTRSEA